MPTFRRQIHIPRSKLPVHLTVNRSMAPALAPKRTAGRISSVPRRLLAASTSEQAASNDIAVTLTLPVPPSINHQYTPVNGRRLLSAAGRAYKTQVGQIVWLNLAQSRQPSLIQSELQSSTLALSIRFYFTSALRRDVDGGLKIAQDALCEGLGINDNRIVETHLYKHVDKNNPRIEVSLTVLTAT